MQPKKILYVITQGGPWGGAQKYVFDLASNLCKEFEIFVAVGEKNNDEDLQNAIALHNRSANCQITLLQLNNLKRAILPVQDFLACLELAKICKKIQPDIIHLNSSKAGVIGSLLKLLLFKKCPPIIYTAHGWVFNEPLGAIRKFIYRFLEQMTAYLKDQIIVLSKNDQETANKILGIKNNKLTIAPLGINLPDRIKTKIEARTQLTDIYKKQINADALWFGTIANFYKTKGIDILIKALAEIKNELRDSQFVLIGDGPERNNIEQLIKKHDLSQNIHLLGVISKASEFLPAFDMFVLPSRKEGLPYTLLEATAYKIPVLATNVGGVKAFLTENNAGIVIEPYNTKELSSVILKVISSSDFLLSLAKKHETNYQICSIKNMVDKTKDIYFSLLAK
jgi:glycosyltransferase involved in cell wall biosynthesis